MASPWHRTATTLAQRLARPGTPQTRRALSTSRRLLAVKPFLLADIGEGIREVQIIQWFVQPGARVEEFDKLCEVQSDKASVEITSRFTGVIKKLHYDSDDMAIVGKPLVDIDIQGTEEAASPTPEETSQQQAKEAPAEKPHAPQQHQSKALASEPKPDTPAPSPPAPNRRHATLATPAVRHLTKDLDIEITHITGTGKDGRVTKEDVQKFASQRSSASSPSPPSASTQSEDRLVSLTPVQSQMFKTMTKSLRIPHFLYSDAIDMTALTSLRKRLQARHPETRISALAFVLKAVSQAFERYPILNARVEFGDTDDKPRLLLRAAHNFGIAVDSPQGLLVPVVKGVQRRSIADIAAEIRRLSEACREGALAAADLAGGSFTVSNVGSIGGGVVAPVIVDGQNAIVGMGRARVVPAFDAAGAVVPREECVLSWSADHRVVDGATVARCAEVVKSLLEAPEEMLVALR